MWITRLQLSDIKSYGPDSAPIHFARGVNLIRGHNGAGKSTILEAIGLALFNSNPYTLRQVVRDGSTRGTITVGFVSALEDREYEVVRGVGGGATYIYDPEVERRVCEGVNDTMRFIRDHLNVDDELDLEKLFSDAIGVPQGTITATFLENASARQQKFDRLLRTESFKRASDQLLATDRYLRDRISANEQARARLSGKLEKLPDAQAQLADLETQVAQGQERLDDITARLAVVSVDLAGYAAQATQLADLDEQLRDVQGQVDRATDRLTDAEQRVEQAQEAAAIVAETTGGHEAYLQAQQTLDALEQDRKARDDRLAAQRELEADLKVCQQRLVDAQAQLEQIAAAEAELEPLAAAVEQQVALEADLKRAEQEQADYARLLAQLAEHDAAYHEQEETWRALQQRAAAAGDVFAAAEIGDEAASLTLTAQLATLRQALAQVTNDYQQLDRARGLVEDAQTEVAAVAQGLADRAAQQAQLDAAVADLARIEAQVDDAAIRQAQVTQALDQLERYNAMLAGAEARCPVCQQPLADQARAESEAHFVQERACLQAEAAEAQALLAALQDEQRQQAGVCEALREAVAQLPNEAALQAEQDRLAKAQDAQDEQDTILAVAWTGAQRAYDAAGELLALFRVEVESLAGAEDRLAEVEMALAALGDPRLAYDRAKTTADERSAIEEKLAGQQAAEAASQAKLDTLATELAVYAALDEQFAAAREARDANIDAHERYLAHQDAAAQLAAQQAARDDLRAQVADLGQRLDALTAERDELAVAYDADAHDDLRLEQRQLETEQAGVTARLETQQESLQTTRAQLEELHAAQDELLAEEKAGERLAARKSAFEFVRSSIRAAGPLVARQLVRLIAEQANQIFGDILGDYSMVLQWSEDYAITVNQRGEDRDFSLLSGGEQMAAAIAVRLALLTHLADVQFAFFDEPTANLDDARRRQLAERLADLKRLQQVFIISHDDTFEQESYHVIQVEKVDGLSQVETL